VDFSYTSVTIEDLSNIISINPHNEVKNKLNKIILKGSSIDNLTLINSEIKCLDLS
jgi:hypothetical protein